MNEATTNDLTSTLDENHEGDLARWADDGGSIFEGHAPSEAANHLGEKQHDDGRAVHH